MSEREREKKECVQFKSECDRESITMIAKVSEGWGSCLREREGARKR